MDEKIAPILELWKEERQIDLPKIDEFPLSRQLQYAAALFSPGKFYFYILHFPTLQLDYIHKGTKEVLGIPSEEVTMKTLLEFLPEEEVQVLQKKESVVIDFFMRFLKPEEMPFYKVVYFFRSKDIEGNLLNMLHQVSVLSLTEKGKVEYVLGIHIDISHLQAGDNKTVSFINLKGGKSYYNIDAEDGVFDPEKSKKRNIRFSEILTKREMQIIKLLASGQTTDQIAENLHISTNTIRTHRKNILKKTGCSSTTEVVAKFIVQGF